MKPASEGSKESKGRKWEESTVSTDDNRVQDSTLRLINSEHLTV